ncbi:transcription factor NIGTH1-like [Zingiber officinale]|uniref:HTH myb-type domain-containing protein n=1 Tax=Zingiber officinale TaxID=94328 RepID=A0A8J5GT12_ZINOF|nr:transcription factor NIGTH1-like [Zingiber officinale]KAG6514447.1 hypothetical protein ZIOFF_024806 [Zingiber officinale]
MASVPAELSLDYTPNTYSIIQKQIPEQQQQQPANTQKIQEFLVRLEEERNKIEAFKRELPLCMQLLNDAIECYKQQLETTRHAKQGAARPVLEEFIPLKNMNVDGGEEGAVNVTSEKPSWMLSSQLWIQPGDDAAEKQVPLVSAKKLEAEQAIDVSPRLALDAKQRNGGAFLPFSKEKNRGGTRTAAAAPPCALPELALASSEKVVEETKCVEAESGGVNGRRENGGGAEHCKEGGGHPKESQAAPSSPAHRKARRCWSPDLHRRFVNALQILGGSQVATPKQIRELMKVDGLTNDEVKSHLQKYRLHTRRPAPAPQAAATAPQLVVLGGIWVPPEYAASAAAPAIYGAHPGAAHYCATTPVPQEFYSTVAPVPQHYHQLHPQLKLPQPPTYKAREGESPESEASSGERSESMVEEEEEGEGEEEDEETEEREGKAALPAVKAEGKF